MQILLERVDQARQGGSPWLPLPPRPVSGETHGFRRVSRKVLRLTEFTLPSGEWRALQIPVALAFFQYRSLESRVVAMYPGPAGAVECALRAAAWDGVLRA